MVTSNVLTLKGLNIICGIITICIYRDIRYRGGGAGLELGIVMRLSVVSATPPPSGTYGDLTFIESNAPAQLARLGVNNWSNDPPRPCPVLKILNGQRGAYCSTTQNK